MLDGGDSEHSASSDRAVERTMRIAILVPGFPPKRIAGTEVATHTMATKLSRRGHDVHVITCLDEGLPAKSTDQGFSVHRIRVHHVRFLGAMLFWLHMFRILRGIDSDVVHVQSTYISIPGLLAKKFLRKPCILWAQGSDIYRPSFILRQMTKLAIRNSDVVIALTEDMKKNIQRIHQREVLVIPNGIDLDKFQPLSRADARGELHIEENERIILFVGRLHPVKGLKYLIRAMRTITQAALGARLILLGEGEERRDLEALTKELNLEDFVTFHGRVPNTETPKFMTASDILVLPSLSEGFPVVVLEAMACGLPIVATNVRGLSEIIVDDQNGFTVEPENPEAIADRVLQLLRDDQLRSKIGENNRHNAKQYSWDDVVRRLESVYDSVAKRNS